MSLKTQGYSVLWISALANIPSKDLLQAWLRISRGIFEEKRGKGRWEWTDVPTPYIWTARRLANPQPWYKLRPHVGRSTWWSTLLDEIWTLIEPDVHAQVAPICANAQLHSINVMLVEPGAVCQQWHCDHYTSRRVGKSETFFTVIVPLTTNEIAAGGTVLCPASHLWDLSVLQVVRQAKANIAAWVTISSQRGQIYIFNGNVAHAGLANTSHETRVFAYYVLGNITTDPNLGH